jgi:hypothetical protein
MNSALSSSITAENAHAYDNFTQNTVLLRLDINGCLVGFLHSVLMKYEQSILSESATRFLSIRFRAERHQQQKTGLPSASMPRYLLLSSSETWQAYETGTPRVDCLKNASLGDVLSRLPQLWVFQRLPLEAIHLVEANVEVETSNQREAVDAIFVVKGRNKVECRTRTR